MKQEFCKDPSNWVVWFDLDDTVWDFSANSLETLDEVYAHFELDRFWTDAQQWKKDYHAINDALWDVFAENKITSAELRFHRFYDTFTKKGVAETEAREMALAADSFYLSRLAERERLVEGARDLLKYLKTRGFQLGILSNGFKDVQHKKLISGKILDFFNFIVLSDDAGITKPDERIFRYAESIARSRPDRCIMIGDNLKTDIMGAVNAYWPFAFRLDRKKECQPDVFSCKKPSEAVCKTPDKEKYTYIYTVQSLIEIKSLL